MNGEVAVDDVCLCDVITYTIIILIISYANHIIIINISNDCYNI